MKSIFALLILALSGSVMGQARPAAVYVPRSFKELDDARGVTLQPNFVPLYDGTKFTPRLIGESDVTDLVSDLAALQPLDAVLTALSSLTPALDKVPYFTGLDTAATFDITSFGRTILSAPTAAQLRVYAETRHNVDVPTVVDPVTRRTSVPVDPDLLIVDNENKGWLQTLEIADDEAITFSGSSLPGYVTHLQVLNSDTADHVLTIPSSYSFARNGATVPITSITIPDGATAELSWRYESETGRYYLVGDPLAATSMIYDLQSPPKLAGDFENRVLYDEDGTSKALAWAGGGITLFSGLGSGSSNILPAGGSGSYIYQFPTRAGFIAISNAAPPSGSPNDFLNANGDYITLDVSGTVTSFSAGDLAPLFTTSEATATTTPALTFALSNAAAWSIFGNGTSGSAAPAFETATGTGSPVRGTGPTMTLTNATGLPPAGVTGTAAILGANTFTGAQTATSLTVNATAPAATAGLTSYGHLVIKSSGNFTIDLDDDSNEISSFFIRNGGNSNIFLLTEAGVMSLGSGGVFGISSTTDPAGTIDVTLTRNAAGIIQFGTTAANASGSWMATNGTLSGTLGIGGTANANAILDAQSTTKAFMPPRMTTTQKNAISTPTAGMVVYDSTLNKLSVYTGSAWETVTSL